MPYFLKGKPMNKNDAQKMIEQLQAYWAEIEKPINVVKPDRPADMPKWGEAFFYLAVGCYTCQEIWSDTNVMHNEFYECGNCYLSLEAAEKAAAIQFATVRVLRKMRKLEGDFIADWDNASQMKCCIYFSRKKSDINICYLNGPFVKSSWYTTKDVCDYLIAHMQDDLKLMYEVE